MDSELEKAIDLATDAHAGQLDKAGLPYICHLISVMEMVDGIRPKIVAVLHDIVEDTDVTLADLRREFPTPIGDAIDSVTRRDDETYMDSVRRAKENPLGRGVKRADILHHLRPETINTIPESLVIRYYKALSFLNEYEV